MRNLDLTAAQRDDANTKRHNIGRLLHNAYYSTTYEGQSNFLGGSHGKGTAIRPPSDIDLMFVVPYETYLSFEQRVGNKQSQLLQHVRSILAPAFPSTAIRADGQVVVVPFVSYRVEVVPCVLLKDSSYWICDTNNGGRWKVSHPKKEIQELNEADIATNGNLRKLVKMAKAWRAFCNVPIKPIMLELVAKEFLMTWANRHQSSAYHGLMFRDFISFLWNRKDHSVLVPGTAEYLALGNDWVDRSVTAYNRARKACEFEAANGFRLVSDEWKNIFGDDFPGPIFSARSLSTLLGGGFPFG